MTDPDLHLEALEIHRMPGFPPTRAFGVEDLAPGVNVLHGPNASGKTTVAEAIAIALHGSTPEDGQAGLRGRLRTDEGTYEVRVDAGQRTFLKNGEPDPGPTLAPKGTAGSYKLWLHELIQAADPNRNFAEEILEQSTGGYNLRKIRKDLRSGPSAANLGQRQDFNKERDALRELKRDVIDPTEIENELREKRQQAQELRAVQRRAAALEKAESYREHQTRLEEATRRLEELPDALEDLSGNEPDTLDKLKEGLNEAEKAVQDEQGRIETAEETLDDVDLPDEDPPKDLVPTLRERVQDLISAEDRIENLKQQAERARSEAEEAREALGDVTDPGALEDVDTELIQRADQLAEKVERLNRRKATLASVEEWLTQGETPAEPAQVQEALRALRRWLQEPGARVATGSKPDRLALVASIVTTLAGAGGIGLALSGLANALVAIGAAIVLLAGLLLLFRSTRTSRASDDQQDARGTYERDFQRTAFEPPSRWTQEAVEARLDELEDTLVEVKLIQERDQQRVRLAPDREKLAEEGETLEGEAEAIADELGVALDLDERPFLWFVRNLADWQAARTELAGAEGQLKEVRRQRADLLQAISDGLTPYGYEEPEDAASARAKVEDLDARFSTYRSAKETLEQARKAKRKAQGEVQTKQDEIDALFEDLGLEPGDEAGLQQLVTRLGDYKNAVGDKTGAKPLRDQALKELRDEPGYDEAMEELGETEIEEELDELKSKLARLDELTEEIPRLEERIRHAKQEDRIEAAIEDRDQALAALRDKMEEETAEVIRWAVADHVHEQTKDQDRPPVFHRAKELFGKITRWRYELEFSDADPPEFRALDTWHKETRTLDQLSSGTRIQLLLAVRLAFVEQQEQGPKLPLLLDETLANTDDIRAKAIIDAVIQIAREGRQVFYLTAQEDEVRKWAAALQNGEGPAIKHQFIDLAEARSLTKEQEAPTVELADTPLRSVPSPDGMDHQAYGEALGVPALEPRDDVGATHLWYLVEDPERLHRLLEFGIQRWGQLRTMEQRSSELDTVLSEEAWNKIRARAKALAAYQSAVIVGRGQPVDRAVLDQAPGVTDKKIDEVAALAEKLNGEPGALLEALDRGEVPYFRDNQYNKLEAFLTGEGYMDARKQLSPEEIQQRTLVSVAEEIDEGLLDREEVLKLLERWTVGR